MKRLLALPLPILAAAAFLLLGAGVTFGAVYIGGGGDVSLQKGLVGHWKFDGNSKDSTPNRNHGTLNGDAAVTANDRKGQANKALTLDGTGDSMSVSSSSSLDAAASALSVSLWVNPSNLSSTKTIASWGASSNPGFGFLLSARTDGSMRLEAWNAAGTRFVNKFSGTGVLEAGTWTHVGFTYDAGAGSGTLYVNGSGAGGFTASDSIGSGGSFYVGRFSESGNEIYMTGLADDARFYSRALSAAEMKALYGSYDPGIRVASTQKGLLRHWKLDGSGKDATPNGKHCSVSGATLTSDRKGQSNKAYSFDGISNYATCGTLLLDDDNMVISGWVKLESGDEGTIFDAQQWFGDIPADRGFYVFYSQAYDYYRMGIYRSGGGGEFVTLGGRTDDGQWHHVLIAVQASVGTATMYVDGASQGQKTFTAGSFQGKSPTFEIAALRSGSEYGEYAVDDVRVYNRALSTAEIAQIAYSYDPVIRVSDLQKGLVSHWKFDGNAKDSTPYRNHGTVNGATLTTDRKGQSDEAYSFDGTGDEVACGSNTSLAITGDITLATWISLNVTDEQFIMSRYKTSSPYEGWGLKLQATTGNLMFWSDGVGSWVTSTSAVPNDGLYHHVLMVGDGASGTFYIDGNTAGTFTYTPPSTASTACYLGRGPSGSDPKTLNGKIDEVRIYSRALSATEIKMLYDSYR